LKNIEAGGAQREMDNFEVALDGKIIAREPNGDVIDMQVPGWQVCATGLERLSLRVCVRLRGRTCTRKRRQIQSVLVSGNLQARNFGPCMFLCVLVSLCLCLFCLCRYVRACFNRLRVRVCARVHVLALSSASACSCACFVSVRMSMCMCACICIRMYCARVLICCLCNTAIIVAPRVLVSAHHLPTSIHPTPSYTELQLSVSIY